MGAVAMGTGVIPAPPKAPGGVNAIGDTGGTPDPASPGGSAPDSQGFETSPAPGGDQGGNGNTPPAGQGGGGRSALPPAPDVQDTPDAPTDDSGSDAAKPSDPGSGSTSTEPTPPGSTTPGGGSSTSPPVDGPGKAGDSGKGKGKGAKEKTPTTPSLGDARKLENAVLKLVNKERAKAGCDALKLNSGLAKLARDFSVDMALRSFFDHLDPDGDNPWDRAEAAGIGNLGAENIARGQLDAESVMDAWMASEGNRANILNCDFKTIGVGVHFGTGGPWWTQAFGE